MSTEAIAEKVKFTPGPWRARDNDRTPGTSIDIWTGESTWLGTAMGDHVGPKDDEEIKANAKLIAAAPDMYDIIKELYDWSIENDSRGLIFPKLEAVINKINS